MWHYIDCHKEIFWSRLPPDIAAQDFSNKDIMPAFFCNTLVKSADTTGAYMQCNVLIWAACFVEDEALQ